MPMTHADLSLTHADLSLFFVGASEFIFGNDIEPCPFGCKSSVSCDVIGGGYVEDKLLWFSRMCSICFFYKEMQRNATLEVLEVERGLLIGGHFVLLYCS